MKKEIGEKSFALILALILGSIIAWLITTDTNTAFSDSFEISQGTRATL